MVKLRPLLFWIHLGVGLTALVFIFIMSATGVLLTYQRQIVDYYDTHNFRAAPPSPDAPRLRPDQIADAVRAVRPGVWISSLTVHADPRLPAEVGVAGRVVFVNPYSGRVWGESTDGPRPFFRTISNWHTGLGTGRDGIGHTIVAGVNLTVVFMIVSGLVLWFPRKWSWHAMRNIVWFRGGLRGKARDFNWHHVLGFWCALPLLLIVLGALPMSYQWASDLLFRAVGEQPEPRRAAVRAAAQKSGDPLSVVGRGRSGPGEVRGGGRGGPRGGGRRGGPAVDMGRVTELWARAEQQGPGWNTIAARLPASANAPLEFTIEQGTSQQPQKRSVLSLDMKTGEPVSLVTFGDRSFGARVRTYLRFAHTGEVLAFPSQTIAAIASAGACVMTWTGLALAWRRFFGGRRHAARSATPAEPAHTS